jgi:hypothetical protein
VVDTLLYVTNPSKNLKIAGSPRELVQVVVVDLLTVDVLYPDGTNSTDTFAPGGIFAY